MLTIGSDGLHFMADITSQFAAASHTHAVQGVSADTGNQLTLGSDGLHFLADFSANYAAATHTHAAQVPSTDSGNSISFSKHATTSSSHPN